MEREWIDAAEPSQAGIRSAAEDLRRLHEQLHHAHANRDRVPSGHERWRQAAERFDEAEWSFRRPYEEALAVLRRGDASGAQRLVDFLQADPWCSDRDT